MTAADHTPAAAERALGAIQRDPAASGYAEHLRRKGYLGAPPAVLPVLSPGIEVAEGEREVRRAVVQAFRL